MAHKKNIDKKSPEQYPDIFDCRVCDTCDLKLTDRHPSKNHTKIVAPQDTYVQKRCRTEKSLDKYLEELRPSLFSFCVAPKKSGFYQYHGRDLYYLEAGKYYVCYYKVFGDWESSRGYIELIVEYDYESDKEQRERIEKYLTEKVKKHAQQIEKLQKQMISEQSQLDTAREKLDKFNLTGIYKEKL